MDGNSRSAYDIGFRRHDNKTFRGYLRDLMIFGGAVIGEELLNITGIKVIVLTRIMCCWGF